VDRDSPEAVAAVTVAASGEISDAEGLPRLFDAQKAAFAGRPARGLRARREALDQLRAVVVDHRQTIADAVSADFGVRSKTETELLEIVPLVNAIRYTRSRLARWMKPQRRHVDIAFQPARAWVQHQPLGVVGVISPWNYPVLLALSPLNDALAAGNRVMLKPSEFTPAFSSLLKTLLAQAFDEDEVAVVLGGPEFATAFSSLPFDHLVFTGSTAIGRKVAQASAPNLTPVTLELGGKSPAIVCPGYSREKAARSLAFGKFVNAGQTCIAPDYVLAPHDEVEPLAAAILARAREAYPTISDNPDYSAIISPRHFDRLTGAIEAAGAAGARILAHEDAGTRQARKIGPTLVLDPPGEVLLLTEEIFGPVLPIVGYHHLDEAIAFVNARDRPLALYVFSDRRGERERVLQRTLSGGVTLNGTLLHIAQDRLPFGGVGPSGMGAYHGYEGFRRLSHARAVHQVGFLNAFERLGPPWGRRARAVGEFLIRRR
jgi:coniferyl-aldehyde dehydrogenase